MTEPTIEEIAEKWARGFSSNLYASIRVGGPYIWADCNMDINGKTILNPNQFDNKEDYLLVFKHAFLAAIREATEAQRQEIERLNRCRDAHHEEINRYKNALRKAQEKT